VVTYRWIYLKLDGTLHPKHYDSIDAPPGLVTH
jgi:hypothetical protein